jgi:hypothetical protein
MKVKLLTLIFTGLIINSVIYGQDQKSNVLIEKGLAYLASVQSTSKGMENLTGPSIDPTSIVPEETKIPGHWQGNVGISALCLQAFVSNGHGVNDPLYGTTVTNAITYILGQQITSGYHTGAFNQTTIGYGTAMAIVALNAAYNNAGLADPLKTEVQDALDLALNYYTQDINEAWTQVSWRYDRSYTTPLNGDMSCNQWVYLALNEMNYTDKDVWNKIYGYINTKKGSSGNMAYIGYQDNSTWRRGNTCAGVWGLILANQHGVAGAGALSQQMYNYLEQYTLAELFNPASIGSHVYDGGGYYYYVYELSKALSLGNKTNFAGGAWYEHLYNRIDIQKSIDGSGNYYWNGWGGQGIPMETALALLSLQTGTVPPGSKLTISLGFEPEKNDCVEFTIFDEFGNEAGISSTSFYNNIPSSEWTSTTGGIWEWLKSLNQAGNYNIQIKNLCPESKETELCFKVYTFDDVLVDEECFTISNEPYKTMAATGFVNAIGGLNVIIVNPPTEIPIMELSPAVIGYNPFEYDQTYNFTFDVNETGNESPLLNIDIFASALVDQFGNTIPANSFTFTPNVITEIPAGGSFEVQGTLTTPASFTKQDIGLFQGLITAQTNQQAKAINFEIGKPTLTASPEVLNVDHLAGTTGFSISFTGFVGADWTINTNESWLSFDPLNGNGNGNVTINYEQNTNPFERTALITVESSEANNLETVISLIQGALLAPPDLAIELQPGWQLISSYIVPDNPALENVFVGISERLVIMLSKNGIYWPSQNINTIGDWNIVEGYKVYMNQQASLYMYGDITEIEIVNLFKGGNYLPVLSQNPVSAAQIFNQIENELILAYDWGGTVYWPEGGIFNLQVLEPGKAYLLLLNADASVTFGEPDSGKATTGNIIRTVMNSPWEVTKSGSVHFISVFESASEKMNIGDILGAFNNDGSCVGELQFDGQPGNLPLFVHGNDFTTEEKNGLIENEVIKLKLYSPASNKVTEILPEWDMTMPNNKHFTENGLSAIKTLKAVTSITDYSLSNLAIYPNPNTGIFNVTGINQPVKIQVLTTSGQTIESLKASQSIEINLSNLAKGIYYLKVVSEQNIRVEKIIIR